MTRRLYYLSTLIFWLAVAAFWAGGQQQAASDPGMVAASSGRSIGAAELARHNRPEDCWMAIRGGIYDLSDYLPKHPSQPALVEPWCGREASQAYATKTVGRPHTAHADRLLEGYRIGNFTGTP